MPKVIITGGAGFIGSNLAIQLLKSGWHVVAVDDLSYGNPANLEAAGQNPKFSFIEADIRTPNILGKALKGSDCIVHLAAYKIPRYGHALNTLNVNNEGTRAVLEAASPAKVRTIIASTSDVYGKNSSPPFKETDDLALGPPHIRRWAYAVSKAFDEQLALAHYHERELPVVIPRFFSSYGPHNHRTWWGGPQAVFIEQALRNQPLTVHGDGLQTRTFCFVEDTVKGIIQAIGSEAATGKVINIGSETEISIKSLAELILKLTGSKSAIELVPYQSFGGNYEDVRRRIPDLSRARQLLQFEPAVALEDGLAETILWHKKFL
jgi:UDP-glucose 4-epimerase